MLGSIFALSRRFSDFKHQKSCTFVLSGEDINGFFVWFYSFIEILANSLRIKGQRYSLTPNTCSESRLLPARGWPAGMAMLTGAITIPQLVLAQTAMLSRTSIQGCWNNPQSCLLKSWPEYWLSARNKCVTQSQTSTLILYVAIIFWPAGNCNSLIPAECQKPRLWLGLRYVSYFQS